MLTLRICILILIVALSACSIMPSSQESSASQPVSRSSSGSGTLLIKDITFTENAKVRDAVKNECQLPEKLSSFIRGYAEDQYANIEVGNKSASKNAQVLSIEIINTSGASGGAWSGSKMVMVAGKLTKNGKLLGDFKARRYSGGGLWGKYKGTCAILGRCVKTLGKDVAEWLTDPSSGASLGNM